MQLINAAERLLYMKNIPKVKIGVVPVSRDCFPSSLSDDRCTTLIGACKGIDVKRTDTVVENETDAMKALDELKAMGANALVVYLGNFGPEGPETMLAQKFGGPVMFCAAAEETGDNLIGGMGDAYCGLLNASYNLGLRNITAYIPENPVQTAAGLAEEIKMFDRIAAIYIGVKNLKIITFGPRPFDFLACNAPIKPLYDLGVEVQENSELDMYKSFIAHENDDRIKDIEADMKQELGEGNNHPGVLKKLAQFELTLKDFYAGSRGASKFGAFANKCWPAFQEMFGFVPCYVNSRLTGEGVPVACETDIYGALTEYMITCATKNAPTLLDINNTVPDDIYNEIGMKEQYKLTDLFMGFHCGNTPIKYIKNPELKHQLIMKRLLEPDGEPNISRGTIEGDIKASEITLFRLQGTAESNLCSYIAQGNVLDIPTRSFGGIGIIAVPEMGRFYRHVLVEKRFPHHAGVGFAHVGKILFEALKLLGVKDINFNRPEGFYYETENPFCSLTAAKRFPSN